MTRTSSRQIAAALDRIDWKYSYDPDGDILVRIRSGEPPWTAPLFYEFAPGSKDFLLRGQFVPGEMLSRNATGESTWAVPFDQEPRATDIAQKVVKIYFTPHPGRVSVQIHAEVYPLSTPKLWLSVLPDPERIASIEQRNPGVNGAEETRPDGARQTWLATAMVGRQVDDEKLQELLFRFKMLGLEMFDGSFTGWLTSERVSTA